MVDLNKVVVLVVLVVLRQGSNIVNSYSSVAELLMEFDKIDNLFTIT